MTPPVFQHGHLRLLLLSLIVDEPRHGYELIQAVSERFGGAYSPSAGTIYPRLAKLESEGLVTKSSGERKSVYAATEAGRAEVEARRDELRAIEATVASSAQEAADTTQRFVADTMRHLRSELSEAAKRTRERERSTRHGARAPEPEAPAAGREVPASDPAESGTSSSDPQRELVAEVDATLASLRTELRARTRELAAVGRLRGGSVRDLLARLKESADDFIADASAPMPSDEERAER